MAAIGTATVKVAPDTRAVEQTARTIAKHMTALADELALARREEQDVD